MTFLERLTLLMEQKGVNKSTLCTQLKISQNSFVNWNNRGTLPSGETLIKLAEYFNVTTDYLLGIERDADLITIPKNSLAALIANMSAENQALLMPLVDKLIAGAKE